MKKGDVAKIY
jgi:hypothetical protein